MAKVEYGIDGNCEMWIAIHITHDEINALCDGLDAINLLAKTIGLIPEPHIKAVMTGVTITATIPKFVIKNIDRLYGRKGMILLLRERKAPLPLPPGSKMPSPPNFPPSYWDMRSAEGKSLYKDL